jgi:hypothetical protein
VERLDFSVPRCTILIVSFFTLPVHATTSSQASSTRCPVEIGHLISIQIISRVSIEGYSLQGLADPWHDPLLSSRHWPTSVRPVIVIDTAFDETSFLFKIQVVSIGQGTPDKPATAASGVSSRIAIRSRPSTSSTRGQTVALRPVAKYAAGKLWPVPNAYCYAFPRALWFYCLPNQV